MIGMPPPRGASVTVQAAEPIGFNHLYSRLCRPDLTKEERRDVFDKLLKTPGGPFRDSHLPLRSSIRSLAVSATRSRLNTLNLPYSAVDPNDVAHDTILVFLDRCHRIRDPRKLKSWLWKVMSRMVLKELGKDWTKVETAGLTLEDREDESSSNTENEQSDENQTNPRAEAVHAALDDLSPSLRAVAKLHGLEGRSYEDTAEILGLAPGAVRVHWFRAKRVLQLKLARMARQAS